MQSFYRKQGRKRLMKERIICREGHLFCGKVKGGEGLCDRLPYWGLTRNFHNMFLEEVETAIRSGIKSTFGIVGF